MDEMMKRWSTCKTLDSLNLSNMQLTALPTLPAHIAAQLKYLYVNNNKLIFVPELGECTQLEELSVEANELTLLPETWHALTALRCLNASRNPLRCLNANIFVHLCQLTELWLNSCQLMYLPKEIGCLRSLVKLGLKSNLLEQLPGELVQCARLAWLNVQDNELREMPDGLARLQLLSYLNVSHNKLDKIPTSVYELRELNVLLLANNCIATLDDNDLIGLSGLQRVDLSANPFLERLRTTNPELYLQVLTLKDFLFQN